LQAIGGIVVALLGVILIVMHSSSLSGNVRPIHLAALIVAVSAWSLGTLVQKHTPLKDRVMSFACVQMFWAAMFQACMATVGNELSTLRQGVDELGRVYDELDRLLRDETLRESTSRPPE